jgi:hypothetical protein
MEAGSTKSARRPRRDATIMQYFINSTEEFHLTMHGHCGMDIPLVEHGTLADCREEAARYLSGLKADGYPIMVKEAGSTWEVSEPDDCVMIPDDCGLLAIRPARIPAYSCFYCDDLVPNGESCSCQDLCDEEEAGLDCGCHYPCMCHLEAEEEAEEAVPVG